MQIVSGVVPFLGKACYKRTLDNCRGEVPKRKAWELETAIVKQRIPDVTLVSKLNMAMGMLTFLFTCFDQFFNEVGIVAVTAGFYLAFFTTTIIVMLVPVIAFVITYRCNDVFDVNQPSCITHAVHFI